MPPAFSVNALVTSTLSKPVPSKSSIIRDGTDQAETIKTDGVLVHIGLDPNTAYLDGIIPLAENGQIEVNEYMESEVEGVFACGDIRSNSPRQVSAGVGDGAAAGMAAQRYLQKQG